MLQIESDDYTHVPFLMFAGGFICSRFGFFVTLHVYYLLVASIAFELEVRIGKLSTTKQLCEYEDGRRLIMRIPPELYKVYSFS